MPLSSVDLATLDHDKQGRVYFAGSYSLLFGSLDYDREGKPYYAANAPVAPDTVLNAEFTVDLTFAPPPSLLTAIDLAANFTVNLQMVSLFVSAGASNKMEIIF